MPLMNVAAVAGAAARVRDQHDEAVGGEVLEHVVEADVVVAERPAVDLEDQRILLRRVEDGGFTIQPITFALPVEV